MLEYYEGGNLSEALGLNTARLNPALATFMERWRLAPQLASGLVWSYLGHQLLTCLIVALRSLPCPTALAQAHLQSLGIIHCDIKASNVLLKSNERHALGHAALADFGLSTTADSTRTNAGTYRYMAPEVSERSHSSCT